MQRAGIAGATGYTGSELVQWIQRHPELEVGWITSENSAGKRLSDVHPVPWDYPLIPLAEGFNRADEVDVVFLCLPHGESIEAAKRFAATGVRVVDLSADFRLADAAAYKKWYGKEHTAPELLASFVYGLCEVNRSQIRGAQLIANPGCYPTSVNLGLYPLAKVGWLGERIIVDSKSSVSGAGRSLKLPYLFVEANENMSPYSVGYRHRHIAEMELVLDQAGDYPTAVPLYLHPAPAADQSRHSQHDVRQRAPRRQLCRRARAVLHALCRRTFCPGAAPRPIGDGAPCRQQQPLCHQHYAGQPGGRGWAGLHRRGGDRQPDQGRERAGDPVLQCRSRAA